MITVAPQWVVYDKVRWNSDWCKRCHICVEACPMRALDAGPLEELKAHYGDIQEVEGFTHSKKTKPSIIFKPRYNSKP